MPQRTSGGRTRRNSSRSSATRSTRPPSSPSPISTASSPTSTTSSARSPGIPVEELIGQDHRIVNSAYHPPAFIRTLWRTIAHGQVWRGEIRNRTKNGEYYWVDTTIVPFVDERGKPRQYLAIRYDITARKAAEAKLREQTALAQLGQLAAVVAHEVRNPLAGIRGSLQVIEGGLPREAGERPVIASIIRRIDQLSRSMEHLLLYARPQRPMLRPVPVSAVLAEVVMSTRAALGSDSPDIAASGDEISVSADPDMLRAVLLNLLLNACQAGGSGAVDVHTRGLDEPRRDSHPRPGAGPAAATSGSACSSRSSPRVPEARGSGLRLSDASRTRRAASIVLTRPRGRRHRGRARLSAERLLSPAAPARAPPPATDTRYATAPMRLSPSPRIGITISPACRSCAIFAISSGASPYATSVSASTPGSTSSASASSA